MAAIQELKKEKQNLETTAAKLLSLALKGGADHAEVCGRFDQKTKINLEKQDYHLASSDDGYQLGLRVMVGNRQGFSSCNTIEPKEIKEVAKRAVEIAKMSPENPHNQIVGSENIPNEAPTNLWDDALFHLSLQTQKDWSKLMMDESNKDSRFRLNEGSITINSGLFLILNSQGTHKLEKETQASWSLMGMAVEGSNITSFDYFQEVSRTAAHVPERILQSSRKLRDRLVKNLKQGNANTYKGLVVFSPRAVADIFLSSLAYHLSGRNVVEGTAHWKMEDLDRSILDPEITLRDLPWLIDRFGCATFDREGTPTRDSTAIEKGVLRTLFLDQYAAKALSRRSTGHAAGGPSALPMVSPHCLCMEGGKEPWADLLKRTTQQQNDFLVVHRYSGQVNPVTGDFSGVAKGGEWWHSGERVYCVKETLISGNLFEALGKSLYGISKETEVVDSSEETPTLVFDQISVTVGKN